MLLEDAIRQIFREELRAVLGEIRAAVEPTDASGQELMPVLQAAAKYGPSPAVINRWFRDGKLKQYGAGRLKKVDVCELKRRLAEMGSEKQREPTQADFEAEADRRLRRVR